MNKTRTMYLVLIASVLAFGFLGVAASAAKAAPQHRTEFMPCATDEGDGNSNCVWDAKHQGNGTGHSFFVNRDGKVTRLPHSIAHFLIHGK